MEQHIAFLGAGRMASAMVDGLIRQGHSAANLSCTCGDDPTGPALARRTGIRYTPALAELMAEADVLVLACKPQQFDGLSPELASLACGRLVLSILAGTRLERLQAKFPQARNVVRAMPNTPGQIAAGITGFAVAGALTPVDQSLTEGVLGALGAVEMVPEALLDTVTAVSGSGPAYVFEFTAALSAAAEAAGLDPAAATRFARATVIGAAKLMDVTGTDVEELRNQVTSPGGTTAAALDQMAADDLRGLVQRGVFAAKARSEELGR